VEKKNDVLQPVIVVTDLTENESVRNFVRKARAAEEKVKDGPMIQHDITWRVFFPHNLPDPIDWRLNWPLREIYLVNMLGRDSTLADIGITPENNRLLYFHQFRFESRLEP
jgi:hypothetical protein